MTEKHDYGVAEAPAPLNCGQCGQPIPARAAGVAVDRHQTFSQEPPMGGS